MSQTFLKHLYGFLQCYNLELQCERGKNDKIKKLKIKIKRSSNGGKITNQREQGRHSLRMTHRKQLKTQICNFCSVNSSLKCIYSTMTCGNVLYLQKY
jgi:hypothetical protein